MSLARILMSHSGPYRLVLARLWCAFNTKSMALAYASSEMFEPQVSCNSISSATRLILFHPSEHCAKAAGMERRAVSTSVLLDNAAMGKRLNGHHQS